MPLKYAVHEPRRAERSTRRRDTQQGNCSTPSWLSGRNAQARLPHIFEFSGSDPHEPAVAHRSRQSHRRRTGDPPERSDDRSYGLRGPPIVVLMGGDTEQFAEVDAAMCRMLDASSKSALASAVSAHSWTARCQLIGLATLPASPRTSAVPANGFMPSEAVRHRGHSCRVLATARIFKVPG